MKRIVKFAGAVAVIFLVTATAVSAQRGMRGTPAQKPDTTNMKAFRGSGPGQQFQAPGFRPNMMAQPGRPGMRGINQPNGRGMGVRSPEMRILQIPGLTENQKKELAYLNLKQTENIQKIREDMAAELKKVREDHKKAVESILTEEQKKTLGTVK